MLLFRLTPFPSLSILCIVRPYLPPAAQAPLTICLLIIVCLYAFCCCACVMLQLIPCYQHCPFCPCEYCVLLYAPYFCALLATVYVAVLFMSCCSFVFPANLHSYYCILTVWLCLYSYVFMPLFFNQYFFSHSPLPLSPQEACASCQAIIANKN